MDKDRGGLGDGMAYPSNVLESFGTGCLLELRVRLAVDFLKSPLYANVVAEAAKAGPGVPPTDIAVHALDVATALLTVSEARGLVEPLPDDDGLNRQLRLQAARTARYSVWQQLAGAQLAAEEQPRVGPVPGGRVFNG
jgi:hypothetical protein